MPTILLIRHALVDAVGRLIAGRMPGVILNATGRKQVEELAIRLAPIPIAAVYTSPLERARETAAAIARSRATEPIVHDGFIEIDFGEWTGHSLESLADDPRWVRFNTCRGGTRIPGGEMMLEVQARVVAALTDLQERHDSSTVAVVTHGDVIKAAVAHYVAMPLDLFHRIEIAPASVSILELPGGCPKLVRLNDTGAL